MSFAAPNPVDQVRVVVIDADDLVRETVAALIGIGNRIEVVGATGRPNDAMELVLTAQPDVVLVDPRLPDLDGGLAFIGRMHHMAPSVKVLVVCSPDFLERAAAAEGVNSSMRKTFRPDELTAAIVATSRASSETVS